jgi:hypothetical protein
MLTLVGNPGGEDNKVVVVGKKPLILTKPIEKEPIDLECLLKLVKKLSNEIFDLKKKFGEGTFTPHYLDPSIEKATTDPNPEKPQI